MKNICRPHLKPLEIIVGPPPRFLPEPHLTCHSFNVTISENAEEAEQGIATVKSLEVEHILAELHDLASSPYLIGLETRERELRQDLLFARRNAEIGTVDQEFKIYGLSDRWGAKRSVRPSEGVKVEW